MVQASSRWSLRHTRPASCSLCPVSQEAAKDHSSSWQVMRFLPGRILGLRTGPRLFSSSSIPSSFWVMKDGRERLRQPQMPYGFPKPSAHPTSPRSACSRDSQECRVSQSWVEMRAGLVRHLVSIYISASGYICATSLAFFRFFVFVFWVFFFCLAHSMWKFQAKDQTCATAITRATAVTMPGP